MVWIDVYPENGGSVSFLNFDLNSEDALKSLVHAWPLIMVWIDVYPEDGGSVSFRNFGIQLPHYAASRPTRSQYDRCSSFVSNWDYYEPPGKDVEVVVT
jgi:hypothetical protein